MRIQQRLDPALPQPFARTHRFTRTAIPRQLIIRATVAVRFSLCGTFNVRACARHDGSDLYGHTMTTLFISDLHLDLVRPAILEQFAQFIAEEAVHADALYILGDLFEAWIGDDSNDEVGECFVAALQPMRDAHKPVFFMHGNRDFLLGDAFARRAGLTLLPDPSVISLYGTPTLLMHGDSLCIDDTPFQAFRKQSRSPAWQRAFLARPVEQRLAFAQQARLASKRYTTAENTQSLMDVNQAAVIDIMEKHRVTRLIHGHTHRPAIHTFDLQKKIAERIVLGDWYEQGSVLRVYMTGEIKTHAFITSS
jgi:UDP-2,3-diacylglucosamine hydrolase